MILVDNSEESKSLLKYFEKQFYNIDNENDIHNIKEICILTAYCYYEVFSYIVKNENARNYIKQGIESEKAIDFLLENAKIK